MNIQIITKVRPISCTQYNGVFRTLSNNRSSDQRCSTKEAVLHNYAIFTGKHRSWSLFLIREIGASCEYCEIFKNTYFDQHLRTVTSVIFAFSRQLFSQKSSIIIFEMVLNLPLQYLLKVNKKHWFNKPSLLKFNGDESEQCPLTLVRFFKTNFK